MRVIKFSHEPAQGQNPRFFRRAELFIAVGTGLAEKRYGTSMEYPTEVPISVIKDQLVRDVLAKFREDLLQQL